MNIKSRGGLRIAFINMIILPLIVLGVFIMSFGYRMYSAGLQNEVRDELYSMACSAIAAYDMQYEGDYNLLVNDATGEMFLRKGEIIISDDLTYIDRIKSETGIDISIFFYDHRMMTTICDESGNRVTQTAAHKAVVDQVLTQKEAAFYNNVIVGGKEFFVQYIPLISEKGVCVGMIGAAKPSVEVAHMVNQSVLFTGIIILIGMVVVVLVITAFTRSLVVIIDRIMHFLGDISKGILSTEIDERVLSRKDELGEMGRFTVHLQGSLKKLIERDALTGLYNRRSGQNRIEAVRDRQEPFAVVMADIDFFKKVNDTYGHDAGDEVLRTVARILNNGMTGKGFVARWGGEEFLMVFNRLDSSRAADFLQEMLDEIRATVVVMEDVEIKVTMSFGVVNGNSSDSIDSQIKKADNGLYYAKMHGRNQVVIADDLEEVEETK